MTTDTDEKDRTLFCGNINNRVTEDILYELFLQAGPLERVKIPLDNMKRQRGYAFVTFKHSVSVPYTIELMNGLHLDGKPIKLQFRQGSVHERNTQQQQFNRSMSTPNMVTPQFSNQGGGVSQLQRHQTSSGAMNGYGGGGRDSSHDRNRGSDYRGRSGGGGSGGGSSRQDRQSRWEISPGALPLMSPAPQRNIDQQRLNLMTAQQQLQQMNYWRQQQQQQRGNQGRTPLWQQQQQQNYGRR